MDRITQFPPIDYSTEDGCQHLAQFLLSSYVEISVNGSEMVVDGSHRDVPPPGSLRAGHAYPEAHFLTGELAWTPFSQAHHLRHTAAQR